MAIISALFSLIAKQLSNLLQAILGWSVTALFGRLPRTKQTALTAVLVVSLCWPLLVVGVFFPAVSAWAFAFAPVHDWVGPAVVRIVTAVLAVLVPPIVGLVTRWVAPPEGRRGGMVKAAVTGYPLTVGYAVSCLLTAVTVPVLKIVSVAKRWTDEHVYVQPGEGKYALALSDLVAACTMAGVRPVIEPVPKVMGLSTRVMRWFARGALDPIVVAEPKRVRAQGIELYLYPADLLVRGEPKLSARVRAKLTATKLEQHAFVVQDPDAQDIQEELMRMSELIGRHKNTGEIGHGALSRLKAIADELDKTYVPFDQWLILDRTLRRLEYELGGGVRALEDAQVTEEQEKRMVTEKIPDVRDGASTADLLREAMEETKELVRLEIALAKTEVKADAREVKTAGIALGAAFVAGFVGLAMLVVALAFALGRGAVPPLVLGVVLVGAAVAAGFAGKAQLPKRPLFRTRRRLETDVKQLKARVA